MTYSCPSCRSTDRTTYMRCFRPDCPDGHDQPNPLLGMTWETTHDAAEIARLTERAERAERERDEAWIAGRDAAAPVVIRLRAERDEWKIRAEKAERELARADIALSQMYQENEALERHSTPMKPPAVLVEPVFPSIKMTVSNNRLMRALLDKAPEPVTWDEMRALVGRQSADTNRETLRVHVSNLRMILRQNGIRGEIKPVPKRKPYGYAWIASQGTD